MITILHEKLPLIQALCVRYRVGRLELIGSATDPGRFRTQDSDVDFLVDFLPIEEGQRAEAYFGLKEGIEAVLDRPVDLVMTRAIRNRFFLQSVASQRTVLYAA